MSKTIVLRPRLSEKTYGLSESRIYVIEVPQNVNRHDVARAVEAQFEVKVIKVNMANISGKAKRTVSLSGKRFKNSEGQRSDLKKAYITLGEGHSLPFFAAVEEEQQKEQETQAQFDKAAAKQASKEKATVVKDAKAAKPSRLGGLLNRRSGSRGGDK